MCISKRNIRFFREKLGSAGIDSYIDNTGKEEKKNKGDKVTGVTVT
jgi:hypothetical protein